MTTYNPPTRGIYDTSAASTNGWYYLCRLGSGQVVQITWLAAENPDVLRLPTPLAGAAFYDIVEKVDTVFRVNNNIPVGGNPPNDWAPWNYTHCAVAHRQSMQRPTLACNALHQPATTTDEPPTQRRVVFPVPLGVVMSAECVRNIVEGWDVPSWAYAWIRTQTFTQPTVFITRNCGLGEAYLPPLPFGFNDAHTFATSWTAHRPRENTSIDWHVTRGNTALLSARDADTPALAIQGLGTLRRAMINAERFLVMGWEDGLPNCRVMPRSEAEPSLAVEIVDLDTHMRTTRSFSEYLTSLYEAWPRALEEEEEEAVEAPVERPLTAVERLERAFGPAVPNPTFAPARNHQQRARDRRELQARRSQSRATAQTATDAIRVTALQHGTVNFNSAEYWPNQDHANRRLLTQMTDQELWNAITYCVRQRSSLHIYYAEEHDRDIVPECWLRDRTLFANLINHSLVREITYADDVATYLATYCTAMPDEAVELPWDAGPARDEQRELREILEARRKALERSNDADRQLRRFDLG